MLASVVICLKNRTFAVSQTTSVCAARSMNSLWFAWKIVLLQYHKQRGTNYTKGNYGCDLLEKSYFCSITNNLRILPCANKSVVICLKNRTFAVSQTTVRPNTTRTAMLWFAWKIVLLQYHKQQLHWGGCERVSCDLLEKSYFCSITNNSNSLRV